MRAIKTKRAFIWDAILTAALKACLEVLKVLVILGLRNGRSNLLFGGGVEEPCPLRACLSYDLQYLGFRDRLLGILVVEHAVGSCDHVLGGHQGAATELRAACAHQSHHPGILVFLKTELVKNQLVLLLDIYRVHFGSSNNSGCFLDAASAG